MKLVIVESPTKAKTISKILGRAYLVKSSYGHVRDLPQKEMGINIEKNFEPKYIVPKKSREKVSILREAAKKAEKIILATDEDREGEAISWHLLNVLKIPEDKVERIVFHEITKSAIEKAIESPRKIDYNLVDAQQARRILDRLVGYELSPFLWKRIKMGLSAGRVQSVALRLIVEREKEIKNFKPDEYWQIGAILRNSEEFETRLIKKNGKNLEKLAIKNEKEAKQIVDSLEKSKYFVSKIEKKEVKRNPLPPFTTSTLQQAANNKLGMSAKQTMKTAQELYEGVNLGKDGILGLITYMRTDSVNLSMESMLSAKKLINQKFGSEYSLEHPRFYKNRSKNAQEAHEAIRPTYPEKDPESIKDFLSPGQMKIYNLIWQRMIASQMKEAIMDSISVDISATAKESEDEFSLRANGSTIKFPGYLKIYGEKMPVSENILPEIKEEEPLELVRVISDQKFTQPPARYNEAALVKTMEEYGIGRPSTYAPTISTIIERNYVSKDENKRLFPEEIGFLVSDLLVEHFSEIVDYKFTAKMEEELDQIADGKIKWVPIIKDFYEPFHKNLEKKLKTIKKNDLREKLERKCPECGSDLVVKFGRFGKFIACTNFPNCRFTEKTAEEKKIEEENSGEICDLCGAPMVVKRGKYGSFLGCSNYPNCKNIKKIEKKLGINCPRCNNGEIIEKKSKFGKIFYGCSAYPKCDFALWTKPTGENCPKCNSLLVFAAKGKVRCSNKECDFEKQNEA